MYNLYSFSSSSCTIYTLLFHQIQLHLHRTPATLADLSCSIGLQLFAIRASGNRRLVDKKVARRNGPQPQRIETDCAAR